MARSARVVVPGLPYHLTHRGNRRGEVFFRQEDREVYLSMLCESVERFGVELWSFCLMTNSVHLIGVAEHKLSFAYGIGKAHMRYLRWINSQRGWTGHLWANRFHSCALDEDHLWAAVRYIEQNPVRARMVARCEDYLWSSCAFHAGLCQRPQLLAASSPFPGGVANWLEWGNEPVDAKAQEKLRRCTATGRPCGSREFVGQLERQLQRNLSPARRGRPRKVVEKPFEAPDLFG